MIAREPLVPPQGSGIQGKEQLPRAGDKMSAEGHRLSKNRSLASGGESVTLIQASSDGWGDMACANEH